VTPIEQRYRRVLRMLPKSYREVWEDDMVATFLASVETDDREDAEYVADYGRPGWPEVLSIAALAIRLRIGSAGAPARYAAWSRAIRFCVLAVLLVHATAGVIAAAMSLWLAGLLPLPVAAPQVPEPPGYPESWRQAYLFSALVGLLWVPAFFGLIRGRAGRWMVPAAAVATVAASTAIVSITGQPFTAEFCFTNLITVLLPLGLAAFHRGAPPVSRRAWLVAFGMSTAVMAGYALLFIRPEPPLPPLDWAGLWCLVVVIAIIVHLARRALGRPTDPAWTAALTILAVTALGMRLATLFDYFRFAATGWHPATVPLAIAEAVVVAAAAAWIAFVSARTLSRLPATTADAAAWSTTIR